MICLNVKKSVKKWKMKEVLIANKSMILYKKVKKIVEKWKTWIATSIKYIMIVLILNKEEFIEKINL